MPDYAEILSKINSQLGNASLMAVSKTRSIEEVMAVYNAGVRLFGENHVQEIVQKFSTRPKDLKLHMIGHLQSNKVKKVVPLVDMIQSVDSYTLLQKIDTACKTIGKVMPVLLELNTSGEQSKSGFESEEQIKQCIEQAKDLQNVKIVGLMTVGPVSCPEVQKDHLTRLAFKKLKKLYDQYPQFCILSMGMSGDYKIGIEEGATLVRIGTLIFGERHYV